MKKDYEKAMRDLAKAREQLDRFHEQDLPRFTRWFNKQFGALLTEVRETSQQLNEKQQTLFEIQSEVVLSGVSPAQAYQRVMHRHNNPAPESDSAEDASAGKKAENFWSGFGSAEEEFFEQEAARASTSRSAHASLSRSNLTRLKDIYRAVVRLLHPDRQKKMTSQKLEWWHEAQAAYEKGDVEQLEVILTLCEIQEEGTTEKASVSILQRITDQLKKTLRQIKTQVTKCRREPAWNFSAREDFTALAEELGEQLKDDLQVLKEDLHTVERQMALWAAEGKKARRPVFRRRRSVNPFGL